ncbi:MAG: hypothetical protein ACJ0HT_03145 [Alphaproteobacteria bacterium]|jgi:hypothetical protein|tara:strand:- start:948 stop:1502 length:555 start_codon:yes stop_codon:yes gene_type:complete
MPTTNKKIRRVVVGNNKDGLSQVIFDSDMPNVHRRPSSPGTFFNEIWTSDLIPAQILSCEDTSPVNGDLRHSPPENGVHWRLVQSSGKRVILSDADARSSHAKMNKEGASELKKGGRHWNMHRTPTVDYGFCLKGERHLVLDQDDILITKGTIVVQLGNWHAWDNRSNVAVDMAYVMMGGEFAS